MRKTKTIIVAIALLAGIALQAPAELPARLTDSDFWKLVSDYSEPDGTFHSENLVSNEFLFQTVIPPLALVAKPGRAYLGVGSEQNFSYIAATRPAIAFIVDIRRGNLALQLVYKALFEMSDDRADFVSRLFSRKRPSGLTTASSADDIFVRYASAIPSQDLYEQNLKSIKNHLLNRHGFRLTPGDVKAIEFVYSTWFKHGPDIRYELNTSGGRSGAFGGGRGRGGLPSYAELMTATDGEGRNRSYLATEEAFRFVKDLQSRNLIIPVVGNLGGPKALRAVGAYLKQQGGKVSAFYVSNVEQYLRQDGLWDEFCANAAALPLDASSTFIRSARGGFGDQPLSRRLQPNSAAFSLSLAAMKQDLAQCPVK